MSQLNGLYKTSKRELLNRKRWKTMRALWKMREQPRMESTDECHYLWILWIWIASGSSIRFSGQPAGCCSISTGTPPGARSSKNERVHSVHAGGLIQQVQQGAASCSHLAVHTRDSHDWRKGEQTKCCSIHQQELPCPEKACRKWGATVCSNGALHPWKSW